MQESEPNAPAPDARARANELLRRPRIRLGAIIAVAVVAGFVAWAVIGSLSSKSSTSVVPVGPVGLSASGLRTLAAAAGQPIYWAGPKPGYLYELMRASNGNVFIRYLPPGAKVGANEGAYLVIATYPYKNALKALKNLKNARKFDIPGGGIALVDTRTPKSVHVAYPDIDYQVEVYDPSPARSLEVARSGDVRPVIH
jgi:hypothetical protein